MDLFEVNPSVEAPHIEEEEVRQVLQIPRPPKRKRQNNADNPTQEDVNNGPICPICQAIFSPMEPLQKLEYIEHLEALVVQLTVELEAEQPAMGQEGLEEAAKCPVCNVAFSSLYSMYNHLIEHLESFADELRHGLEAEEEEESQQQEISTRPPKRKRKNQDCRGAQPRTLKWRTC